MKQSKFWQEFIQSLSIILINNFIERNGGEIYLILKMSQGPFSDPLKKYTFLVKKKGECDYYQITGENTAYSWKNTETVSYRLTINDSFFPNCSTYGSIVRLINKNGLFFADSSKTMVFFDEKHSSVPLFRKMIITAPFDIPCGRRRCLIDIEKLYNNVDSFNNYNFFYEKFMIFLLCLKRKSLYFPLLVIDLIVEFSKDHTFIVQTFLSRK